jgi:hypothetical protein
LADATLAITTTGEPRFVPGKTPLVAERPYVRFVRTDALQASGGQDIALNRPTGASSEAPGHDGSRAVDGNPTSYWSANDTKAGAWWQVDLEEPHTVTSVITTFPAAGNYRYRIEGSPDGRDWSLLVDQTQTESVAITREFVRITVTALPEGRPAAIATVKIEGSHWP